MSVVISKESGIGTIRLNRPEKYNSINKDTALTFQKALDDFSVDDHVRCVVITGTGKAFCAGQDLGEVVDPKGPPLDEIVANHYNPIVMRLRNIQKPVIAKVNGVAAGAGANIALACDIVIASERASFIQAFSKIGLIPDSGGTFFLPRLVGPVRATALMMLGDKISAVDAQAMGMIYQCAPDDELDSTVEKIASKLAKMPTKALGYTKKLIDMSWSNDLEKQLSMEHHYQVKSSQTHDYREGVAAFLEKRKPDFKGE